jgi:uncharacterized peroxidase-related enzyme
MANHGRLTNAIKRLIGYMASYTAGCRYCQAHSIRAVKRYGGRTDQLENIWEYKTHPAFSDAERAALDFAVAASTIPNSVDDTIGENLRKHWDDAEIVEMLGVNALFGYLNRWNDSMGTEMEQGAIDSGMKYLSNKGWFVGKHQYRK